MLTALQDTKGKLAVEQRQVSPSVLRKPYPSVLIYCAIASGRNVEELQQALAIA